MPPAQIGPIGLYKMTNKPVSMNKKEKLTQTHALILGLHPSGFMLVFTVFRHMLRTPKMYTV